MGRAAERGSRVEGGSREIGDSQRWIAIEVLRLEETLKQIPTHGGYIIGGADECRRGRGLGTAWPPHVSVRLAEVEDGAGLGQSEVEGGFVEARTGCNSDLEDAQESVKDGARRSVGQVEVMSSGVKVYGLGAASCSLEGFNRMADVKKLVFPNVH